jgi:tetrahydromethanopterin S-methyltransferase subunit E
MIVGLSLGSILSMFCNGDIMEVYLSWSQGTAANPVVDIVLGVVLFVVGIIGAYLLVRYQKKQDEIAKTSANE